ncbi:ABC transporter, CydDC cysteine exporter CydDC-E family, permease/ATP-binding protein CydD [Asticcacaulis biprosthecium C19]|uniref:ABC transporter, CydDC cysteine exporter CydDC-E family, permease/ATP-binding protein CydD n=1 Tax=Asticcacaulis biprosthecium C19 TaxID=715226 RepID=F4QTC5_9CAUL|nr:thiol reductant ABC exporter subunit CydD [Asticcacaulis biprosthecium]EGF89995.1 ABC transporter, CydDC cysteine exporter CydDC-E family, permease/ATP-binding protein CydD [Asticcacaulis biprosthecium C19]
MSGETTAMRRGTLLALAEASTVIGFAWGLSHLVTDLWAGPRTLASLALPAAVVVVSLILRAGLGWAAQTLNLRVARRVARDLRLSITARALEGRIDALGQRRRLNALFEDSEALEGYYARFHQADMQARLLPVTVLIVIAFQSWVCALILGLTLIPFVAMMAVLGLSSADESRRQLDALSRLSNLLLDRIRALPVILAFGDGPRQIKAVGDAAVQVADSTLRVLRIAFVTSAVLEFFSALAVALIAVYCGFYLLGDLPFPPLEDLRLETAFFVLALCPEVYAPMRRLAAAYHDRQSAMAAAERLMAIEIAPAIVAAPRLSAAPRIDYDNVTIGFADDPDHKIGPVRFCCQPGSVTCLTGPTGSGKSTLLRRILAAEGENIRVNGMAVGRDHDVADQIAYVSQSPPLIAGTLADNLRLGNREATDEMLQSAIRRTGLAPAIASRPDGLNTVLDDRGSGISGGERRRIGLARALLRPAHILLLDEPTADLDIDSETAVLALLPELFRGRTVILTSHAERVMALADQVVAL